MLVSLRFVDSYGNSEANNINYVTVSLFITSQADFLSDPLLRISTFMNKLDSVANHMPPFLIANVLRKEILRV